MTRNISTLYFDHNGDVLKTNYSSDANTALTRAGYHMQINHYGAWVAHVVDEHSMLLAAVVRHVDARIETFYYYDPATRETKLSLPALEIAYKKWQRKQKKADKALKELQRIAAYDNL